MGGLLDGCPLSRFFRCGLRRTSRGGRLHFRRRGYGLSAGCRNDQLWRGGFSRRLRGGDLGHLASDRAGSVVEIALESGKATIESIAVDPQLTHERRKTFRFWIGADGD